MNKTALIFGSLALVTGLALAQTTTPVPVKPAPAATTTAAVNCTAALKTKVNINAANLETLKCLPGFSDKIAKDVMVDRPFKDVTEFNKKIGKTGPSLWKKIETFATFK